MAKKKSKTVEAEVVETTDFVPETQPITVTEDSDHFKMPADVVRHKILELKDKLKDDYVSLCELLYQVNKKMMYTSWGYGTFDEYVSKEMEFERSKARHLVQIWESLYERQSDKNVFTKVMALGWTKASKLVNIVNSDNVDEWVEKGKYQSVEALSQDVKQYLSEKIPSDPTKALEMASEVEGTNLENVIKPVTLQQRHDDYLATCQAVEMVQAVHPGVSFSEAVSLIARDYVAGNPVDVPNVDRREEIVKIIKKYEESSGYRFVVIDGDAKDIVYGMESLMMLKDSFSTDDSGPSLNITADIAPEDAFA